jgi:ADP-ribosylglycohydrolase
MSHEGDALRGCLLGLAVGDALGLPCENLSPRRAARLFPRLDRHQFVFRRGLFSDDTEHACLTGQALLRSGGDPAAFTRDLARRLRWWALGLPAGAGRATLRACVRLWLGRSPDRSGVYSAGNGPAMRAPLLGVSLGHDRDRLIAFVRGSTRLTHTDPKAECGALAVAWAAHLSAGSRGGPPPDAGAYCADVQGLVGAVPAAAKLLAALDRCADALRRGKTTEEFAADLGLARGVSGYMYHTVPVAVYAWLRHPDEFRTAVQSAVRCGGDTDSVAAVAGGLVGARVGRAGIPAPWLAGVIDWPRSVRWIEALADRLAEGTWRTTPQRAHRLAVWALPARNAAFFGCVIVHVARRLLPPY